MCASGKFRVIVTFMVFLSVLHLHANWEYPPVPIVEDRKSDNHTRDIRSIAKGKLNDDSILCNCFCSYIYATMANKYQTTSLSIMIQGGLILVEMPETGT